ncbi:MAG: hotdog fold thioesterase [Flavobacteriaceae bacterium]|nr:hotdog fold thioesterase [Flavobacteriaceae bacterium]
MDKKLLLEKLNASTHNTLMETLEIEYTDVGEDFVKATMPVSSKVHQPAGLLHGGATVALAESLGSAASHLFIDSKTQEVRGIEITANHLRSVRNGLVTATAKAIHKGRSTQLWEIRVTDEKDQLISICKLTTIVLDKK